MLSVSALDFLYEHPVACGVRWCRNAARSVTQDGRRGTDKTNRAIRRNSRNISDHICYRQQIIPTAGIIEFLGLSGSRTKPTLQWSSYLAI
jgi:hypothetical protein